LLDRAGLTDLALEYAGVIPEGILTTPDQVVQFTVGGEPDQLVEE
jgi:hypothetical protein